MRGSRGTEPALAREQGGDASVSRRSPVGLSSGKPYIYYIHPDLPFRVGRGSKAALKKARGEQRGAAREHGASTREQQGSTGEHRGSSEGAHGNHALPVW